MRMFHPIPVPSAAPPSVAPERVAVPNAEPVQRAYATEVSPLNQNHLLNKQPTGATSKLAQLIALHKLKKPSAR